MSKHIPMIDMDDPDFKEKLEFNLQMNSGSSDYSNNRDREYNGQPWTDSGVRGKTEVKGLTMRDIKDCLIKAMLLSGASKEYLEADEFMKCWDFSECKKDGDEPKPTQYLLDNQDKYVSTKVATGNWRPNDVYKLNWDEMDPLAVASNMTCEIEKMMGIYPNLAGSPSSEDIINDLTK
jgi:hypothetical protein